MKKKIIILTAFMGLLLSACSDFLDRKPLTQPEDKGFLVGREQLENYINGLYSALPTPTQFGMSVRGEEVNSDNILAEKYDKRLNGENNQFSGATDWEKGYQNLRNVNYFFYHFIKFYIVFLFTSFFKDFKIRSTYVLKTSSQLWLEYNTDSYNSYLYSIY